MSRKFARCRDPRTKDCEINGARVNLYGSFFVRAKVTRHTISLARAAFCCAAFLRASLNPDSIVARYAGYADYLVILI